MSCTCILKDVVSNAPHHSHVANVILPNMQTSTVHCASQLSHICAKILPADMQEKPSIHTIELHNSSLLATPSPPPLSPIPPGSHVRAVLAHLLFRFAIRIYSPLPSRAGAGARSSHGRVRIGIRIGIRPRCAGFVSPEFRCHGLRGLGSMKIHGARLRCDHDSKQGYTSGYAPQRSG